MAADSKGTVLAERLEPVTAGASLRHTCAEHPRTSDGPHRPGCKALCGFVSKKGGNNPSHARDSRSCVVCDAMFDALYGGW